MLSMNRTSFDMGTHMSSTTLIEFKEYKDSFNMIVGTYDKSIDLWDNPYIRFNVYQMDQNWHIQPSENIKLR